VSLFFSLVSGIVLKMEYSTSSNVMDVILILGLSIPHVLAFLFESNLDFQHALGVDKGLSMAKGLFHSTVGRCIVWLVGPFLGRARQSDPGTRRPLGASRGNLSSDFSHENSVWTSRKFGASFSAGANTEMRRRSHLADGTELSVSHDLPEPAQGAKSRSRRRISRMLEAPPSMRGIRKKPMETSDDQVTRNRAFVPAESPAPPEPVDASWADLSA
jgi:hypothetical protein